MIYFDNSATTRVSEEAAKKAYEMMTENFGNPSSLHYVGSQAYQALNEARGALARILSANVHCIYFTSGGTEANCLVLQGGAAANRGVGNHIVTTAIEHDSILRTCQTMEERGYRVTYVKPDPVTHAIRAQDMIDAVDDETCLVSCMLVNNESGELLPVHDMIAGVRAKNPKTRIHVDCVQAFGKVPFKLYENDVDFVSASSHKIHGPKGVGMLYIKDGASIEPFKHGGSQEGKINPGTENVPNACGFGKAAEEALPYILENEAHVAQVKAHLIETLKGEIPGVHFNQPEHTSSYVLNFSLPGHPAHEMVSYCSLNDIYVSAGSACTKGAKSHVLMAMGYPDEVVNSCLRVSFCKHNTIEETDRFVDVLKQYLKEQNGR